MRIYLNEECYLLEQLLKIWGGGVSEQQNRFSGTIAASPQGNCYPIKKKEGILLEMVEAEENRRMDLTEKYKKTLELRALAAERLLDLQEETLYLRITQPEQAVRGLTRNAANWEETIPPEYRRFCPTVFSDESASHLPKLRPEIDAQIQLKEGEKLWNTRLYDMSKEQLEVLKKLLDKELASVV